MMKRFKLIFALIGAVLAVLVGLYQLSNAHTFQLFGELVPRVKTTQRAVALTFDDGPTPEATEQILAVLQQRNVKATFFLIGAELAQQPEAGKRLAAAGHELGNHSYTHQRMVFKSPSFIREEIERTDELIRAAGYQGQIHFRSPFGKKLALLPYYLSRTQRKNIFWDIEPESDPKVAADTDKIVAHVLERAQPGSIILLHVMYPSRSNSLRAVPGIIDGLQGRGYEFKTVAELLASK